ncbi:MAG: cupredoxin domain-containing protein [Planctomycetota bacterium]
MNARFVRGLAMVTVAALLAGCDSGTTSPGPQAPPPQAPPPPPPPSGPPPSPAVTTSEWVDLVDWTEAQTVEVLMVETSGTEMSFSPNDLSFEAGKPYILKITNPASNAFKHYFSPEGLTNLYQAVATRKVQTPDAEYKAPYFDAVELLPGGSLEIFMVPVLAGEYDIVCTIPGHKEFGMVGTAAITGGEGYELDLEVATDFDQALTSDSRKSGSHEVWADAVEITVGMAEASDAFAFVPPDIELAKDVGYKLELVNAAGNASKHYYTAVEFYKTTVLRKAEDSNAEIKAPYLKAVELLIGGSTELFIVPTAAGTFETICTIPGHAELGMTGTIEVTQ